MLINFVSAVEKFNIDPETEKQLTQFFGVLMILIVVTGIIAFIAAMIKSKNDDKEFEKTVTFDEEDSRLLKGSHYVKIPDGTIEYYVCKMIFADRQKFQTDTDILEEYDKGNINLRPVYQAVLRVNKKAEDVLGLDNLLIRGRDKTALNEKYR